MTETYRFDDREIDWALFAGFEDLWYHVLNVDQGTASVDMLMKFAPDANAMIGAEVTLPREILGGEVFFGGQAAWEDDYFMGNANEPETLIEAHTLVNAQVGWRSANWETVLECKNCFDEEWFGTNLFNTLYTADPVRWGLRLKYSFR